MKKFLIFFLMSLLCFIPVNAKEDKYTIVSNDIKTVGSLVFLDFEGYEDRDVSSVIENPTGLFDKARTVYFGNIKQVKISEGVISNNSSKIDLIFNDLGQEVEYETIVYNDTDNVMYVNALEVENSSEEFIEYKLDENSLNKVIEPNGASLVTFYVKTLKEEGAGRNLDDEVIFKLKVSDAVYNPNTFSNWFEMLILLIVLIVMIFFIRKIKKKNAKTLVFVLGISLLGGNCVKADTSFDIVFTGNIKYESKNIIMITGTVLNDKYANYTNSKGVWAYYDRVKNIEVKSLINKPKDFYKEFDLSEDKSGSVKAYLIENGSKDVPYDLTIMSNGVVVANEDASFMFSFPNTEKVEGLTNVDFRGTSNMQGMFIGNKKLEMIDINAIEFDNAVDTSYMFYDNDRLDVTIKDFDVDHVNETTYMTNNYLVDIIKKSAKSDENMDYILDSNSGNYLYHKTSGYDNPIYYYRGDVKDNNVKFAGFCWNIVRTTETGGIKLLYNGVPDENGGCIEYNSDAYIGGGAIKYSAFQGHLGAAGYMYGDTVSIKGIKLASVASEYIYGNDVIYDENTNTYTLIDTIASSNWRDDMNKIAKKYHYSCFNETGKCSIVYYVITPTNDVFEYPDSTYVSDSYYIEVKSGKKFNDMIDDANKNINNSDAKKVVDNWYLSNLVNYTSYLEDTVWCNDRTIINGALFNKDIDSILEFYNYFAGGNRIKHSSFDGIISVNPSLVCDNFNDKFTVSDVNGNGALTYPIGLLTVDELSLIGGTVDSNNKYFYNDKCWWTMSPEKIAGNSVYGFRFFIGGKTKNSSIHSANINVSGSGYIRPSISLRSGTKFLKGTGTFENPYVIE